MIGTQQFFTLKQVAELRGISVKTVLNAIHAGELGAYRYSARVVIVDRPDLEAWRMPSAKAPEDVAILLPDRERYSPKDVACDFSPPVKSVRLAMSRGQLKFRRINSSVIEITPAAVAAWRAVCRRLAKEPVARGISRTGKTFRKGHDSALKPGRRRVRVAA